jgi:hypothetical protein
MKEKNRKNAFLIKNREVFIFSQESKCDFIGGLHYFEKIKWVCFD